MLEEESLVRPHACVKSRRIHDVAYRTPLVSILIEIVGTVYRLNLEEFQILGDFHHLVVELFYVCVRPAQVERSIPEFVWPVYFIFTDFTALLVYFCPILDTHSSEIVSIRLKKLSLKRVQSTKVLRMWDVVAP